MGFARQYEALQAEFTAQIESMKAEIAASISTQLSNVYVLAPASSRSYAAVAQSSPLNQPSIATISTARASRVSETLYCTIDTSKVDESKQKEVQLGAIQAAIEKEIRTKGGNWRCSAVMRDPRNTARIRVACRNEDELKAVK
jgi:hypothetical protein